MEIVPLKLAENQISLLHILLQKGVFIKARLGCSIRSLLCDQFGLSPDYVKNRIQTAFLNGKPVDDFDTAVIGEGSVLTLSGAMPGLAGATLRKGGFYSAMRATVTHRDNSERGEEEEGFITIRVFNILLNELAPVLLAFGVYLRKDDFNDFVEGLSIEERKHFRGK